MTSEEERLEVLRLVESQPAGTIMVCHSFVVTLLPGGRWFAPEGSKDYLAMGYGDSVIAATIAQDLTDTPWAFM